MTVVRVYSKPSCVQCDATYRRLDMKHVDYIIDDITDPLNLAAAKALGHTSAPVVVVGDESWSGYRPDLIDKLAERMEGTI